MTYSGVRGAFPASNGQGLPYTSFPTSSGSSTRSTSKPCAYGDRLPDGKCPKKPKVARARKAKMPRLVAVPKTLKAPQITRRNPLKVSTEGKLIAGAVAYGGRGAARKALTTAGRALANLQGKTVGGTAARAAIRAGAGAAGARLATGMLLGGAAMAGLLSYYITKGIIDYRRSTKEARAQNAFEMAKAYRRTRIDIETRQKRPMTPNQHQQLAAVFQAELAKLGLSSRDLSKLSGG